VEYVIGYREDNKTLSPHYIITLTDHKYKNNISLAVEKVKGQGYCYRKLSLLVIILGIAIFGLRLNCVDDTFRDK